MVHVEGDTDMLGRKKASYLDYVELWRSIIDPTHLKVVVVVDEVFVVNEVLLLMRLLLLTRLLLMRLLFWWCYCCCQRQPPPPPLPHILQGTHLLHLVDPVMRKTLHQLIFDEFVGAIFKLSRRLDLSFRSSFPEVQTLVMRC